MKENETWQNCALIKQLSAIGALLLNDEDVFSLIHSMPQRYRSL
jgi:hypothetical protein